jgi:hypothetical protein
VQILQKRHKSFAGTTAFVQKWRGNWPLAGGAFALLGTGAFAAVTTLASGAALFGRNPSPDQTLAMVILVAAGVGATAAINLGIRVSAVEKQLESNQDAQRSVAERLEKMVQQLGEIATLPSVEAVEDDEVTWARLSGTKASPVKITMPTWRNECRVRTTSNGEILYDVCPARAKIWSDRLNKGPVEIVIPTGMATSSDDNQETLVVHRRRHDIGLLVRMALFFDSVEKCAPTEMSNLRVYFTDVDVLDRRSVFIGSISQPYGEPRHGVIVYGNGINLDAHHGERGVIIHYAAKQLGIANTSFNRQRDGGTRWTSAQLLRAMQPFLPTGTSNKGAPIPETATFDHKSPYSYEPSCDELIENADGHFVFRAVSSFVRGMTNFKTKIS